MPQYHLIVAVDVDPNGTVTDTAVDYDLSLSPVHFPYGNVYDAASGDDKELMAEWRTATSAAYATDKESPTADPGYDVAVEAVETLLAPGRKMGVAHDTVQSLPAWAQAKIAHLEAMIEAVYVENMLLKEGA